MKNKHITTFGTLLLMLPFLSEGISVHAQIIEKDGENKTVTSLPSDGLPTTTSQIPEGTVPSADLGTKLVESQPNSVVESADQGAVATDQSISTMTEGSTDSVVTNELDAPPAGVPSGQTASGTNGTANWIIDSEGTLHIHSGLLGSAGKAWSSYKDSITKVVVEGAVETPAIATGLFYDLERVTEYVGLEKIDVSNSTDLSHMFDFNLALTKLDLRGIDMRKANTFSLLDHVPLKELSLGVDARLNEAVLSAPPKDDTYTGNWMLQGGTIGV
ncbi:putative secreted protein [Enterococcus faecalis AZ19]|uniref:hypothetical protein n=1 Tax=Enterococcus TaxID=1350 RepID=UPI00045ACC11|nr:hypothetical protein [Enterococcus faecalis]KAJ72894.1 putative secreted protein [Enterococcus faecalis AZ19]